MEFVELSLLEMLDVYGEDELQAVLSSFVCPKNIDVETFIQKRAILFSKQRVAMTYLVFSEAAKELVGYFTLANKLVEIEASAVSKSLKKRIEKFSQHDSAGRFVIPMPLIAQLGKNFDPSLAAAIPGSSLLEMACQKVQEAQRIIGGKAVYVECDGHPKLRSFYSASQFVPFGQRAREKDELGEGPVLVQMLRYFRS